MALKERTHGPVRRISHRRKQQVQRRANEAVQILKALDTAIQKAMDTHWYSSPQRINGPLWADLYIRFRTVSGEIYHALPTELFHSIRLWGLHMEPSTRCFPASNRTDSSADPPALVSGLPGNASLNQQHSGSKPSSRGIQDLSKRRKRIHSRDGERSNRSC